MDFAALPPELFRDVLFRAAKGEKAKRVAELLSVCKLFRCEIKNCSVNHVTQARPDANQLLKLQDCAALNSLVVGNRSTSLITEHFAQSGTAVAVQALTSLRVVLRPSELWKASWLEIERIINVAPALAVVVLEKAPATILTCLGSLHALVSLKFMNLKTAPQRIPRRGAGSIDPFGNMHSIMHLTTLRDLYLIDLSLQQLPDSIGQLTALQALTLSACLTRLPDSIGQLTALQFLNLTNCNRLVGLPDSIRQLTALKLLKLRNCGCLIELPYSIGNLSALQTLDLSHCTGLVS